MYCTYMVILFVTLSHHPRQTIPLSRLLRRFLCACASDSPNSFPLTLLADPHPLNLVPSTFCENIGGWGIVFTSQPGTHASPLPARRCFGCPLFSYAYELPILQVLSFDIHTKCREGTSLLLGTSNLQHLISITRHSPRKNFLVSPALHLESCQVQPNQAFSLCSATWGRPAWVQATILI